MEVISTITERIVKGYYYVDIITLFAKLSFVFRLFYVHEWIERMLHETRDAQKRLCTRVLLIEVSSSFVGTLEIGRNIGPVGERKGEFLSFLFITGGKGREEILGVPWRVDVSSLLPCREDLVLIRRMPEIATSRKDSRTVDDLLLPVAYIDQSVAKATFVFSMLFIVPVRNIL